MNDMSLILICGCYGLSPAEGYYAKPEAGFRQMRERGGADVPRDCRRHQGRCALHAVLMTCDESARKEIDFAAGCVLGAAGLKGSRASPDVVALLTSREETAELLKMKQSAPARIAPPSPKISPSRCARLPSRPAVAA
jgi:hypothetical protein